jgi:hypothetical protein
VTINYGYGTGNDLLATKSVGGTVMQTIGYTADGRMASFSPGIQALGGQYITSLSYNQDAQLAAVNAGSTALANYTYDAFEQRCLRHQRRHYFCQRKEGSQGYGLRSHLRVNENLC